MSLKNPTRLTTWPNKLFENLQWFGKARIYWHLAFNTYLGTWSRMLNKMNEVCYSFVQLKILTTNSLKLQITGPSEINVLEISNSPGTPFFAVSFYFSCAVWASDRLDILISESLSLIGAELVSLLATFWVVMQEEGFRRGVERKSSKETRIEQH